MNHRVGIYFKWYGKFDHPAHKPESLRAYKELNDEFKALDCKMYILAGRDTYLGKLSFSGSLEYDGEALKQAGPVAVDLIYNRSSEVFSDTYRVVNHPVLNDICLDKFKTFELFKDISPASLVAKNEVELAEALAKLSGNLKVVKPTNRGFGKRVFIGNDSFLLKAAHKYPVLVQEFIDSSLGIPGVISGTHDLRAIIVNGKIGLVSVRTPPAGSLVSNVAQGGMLKLISESELPDPILEFINIVDAEFIKYQSRIYTIDLAISPTGPKLIELNSMPSIREDARGDRLRPFKQMVAKALVDA